MSLACGAYGPVEVIRGPFKGQVGYYDDDWCQHTALVYFDALFDSVPVPIHRSWLRPSLLPHLPTERFVREEPEAAALLGIDRRHQGDS